MTGPELVLLAPVALGSRSNGRPRPTKSMVGEADVTDFAAAAAFNMRWVKVLNGRSPSSVVPEVRSAVGCRSGFIAAVKPACDVIPLLLVHEATAHEHFQV